VCVCVCVPFSSLVQFETLQFGLYQVRVGKIVQSSSLLSNADTESQVTTTTSMGMMSLNDTSVNDSAISIEEEESLDSGGSNSIAEQPAVAPRVVLLPFVDHTGCIPPIPSTRQQHHHNNSNVIDDTYGYVLTLSDGITSTTSDQLDYYVTTPRHGNRCCSTGIRTGISMSVWVVDWEGVSQDWDNVFWEDVAIEPSDDDDDESYDEE
jgi:hypothetical protein